MDAYEVVRVENAKLSRSSTGIRLPFDYYLARQEKLANVGLQAPKGELAWWVFPWWTRFVSHILTHFSTAA